MWNRRCPEALHHEVVDGIARMSASLGGPVSKSLLDKLSDPRQLIASEIDYSTIDVNDAIYARQILALFQKNKDLDIGVDKEAVAWEKFRASEDLCKRTNAVFRHPERLNSRVQSVLHRAARKISDVLGPPVPLSDLRFAFGPGATTSVKMAEANIKTKLSAKPTCSPNLLPFVKDLLSEVPLYSSHHASHESEESWFVDVELSDGKLQFVPKNARTYRSIVVEPTLNGLFQKGVGSYMKERLLRSGVNLFDQTRNQSLARKGSIDGSLATIDLSSASDTVASGLVAHLLPYYWYRLLDCLRTPDVTYRGERIRLEKFSSMGNAYTFELESLIFYALATAVVEMHGEEVGDVSVYGDDIIVPVSCYDSLVEVLTECGFSVNQEKSFSKGPFRESCGADYLHGIDVRPAYIKQRLRYMDLFTLHNFFVRVGEYQLSRLVLGHIPSSLRIFGPNGYGDGHLLGTYTLRRNRKTRRDGWEGGFFETYRLRPKRRIRVLPGDWVVPSYSIYVSANSETEFDPDVVRGSVGFEKISIYTLADSVF